MSNIPTGSRKNPGLITRIFKKILREIKWIVLKTNFYKKILKIKYPINTPGEIIWINPNLINRITFNYKNENPVEQLGLVEGGDWDEKYDNIENLNIYNALYELIINKKSLKKTDFYNPDIITKDDYKNEGGTRKWKYISEYEYKDRIKKINELINNISTKGYLTQTQLNGNPNDEIIVKIGRNGDFLFFNGIHRLCISKILKIDKIPVVVKTRHKDFAKLKEELYLYSRTQHLGTKHEGELYQKLAHPDLQDIPYAHDNTDRFLAIKNNLFTTDGTILDIGANFGFFSAKFSEAGYDCTAIELNNKLFYFLKKLNDIDGMSFKILHQNILNMFDKPVEFDIVLGLNIFHHFLKTEGNYNKFIVLLNNLKMKEMFFEPHHPNEKQFTNAYKNLNNEQFLKLIINNTNLTKCKKILDCEEDRYLYHLWC